jgi:hypothetical protein
MTPPSPSYSEKQRRKGFAVRQIGRMYRVHPWVISSEVQAPRWRWMRRLSSWWWSRPNRNKTKRFWHG